MTVSVRQSLVDAVKARLSGILTANQYAPGQNYLTDIGSHQFEWRTTPLEAADLPAHIIRDEEENTLVTEKNQGHLPRSLKIVCDLVLSESDQTATNARKAIADVIHAIGVDDKWGGLARRTLPVKDELMMDAEGKRISGARVTFQIEYGRAAWTP
ncbi:MAG: hypothetical protein M3362_15570 [Acidobacteriota bacterium]|nr:hypothetical protein [Acidobacteriota bacterium]